MQQTRIRVSRRGAARWRQQGHPWIYRSDVIVGAADAGAVIVEGEHGGRVGTALWSPTSQIAVRMLTSAAHGVDAMFWRDRIGAAVAYRAELAPDGTAYRVVHGEADGLPSLVVDRYGEYLV